MAVRLNRASFDHAKALVKEGEFVVDERDAWSGHQGALDALMTREGSSLAPS
jgi:hypothetical protein